MGRSRSRSPVRRVERRRSHSRERDRERRRERRKSRSRSRSPRRRRRSRSRSPRRRRSRSNSPRRPRSRSKSPSSKEEVPVPAVVFEESELEGKTEEEIEMMKIMGFANFDTTKGKHVPGSNNASHVAIQPKRKYRQYMNRRGGFNRPLDFIA